MNQSFISSYMYQVWILGIYQVCMYHVYTRYVPYLIYTTYVPIINFIIYVSIMNQIIYRSIHKNDEWDQNTPTHELNTFNFVAWIFITKEWGLSGTGALKQVKTNYLCRCTHELNVTWFFHYTQMSYIHIHENIITDICIYTFSWSTIHKCTYVLLSSSSYKHAYKRTYSFAYANVSTLNIQMYEFVHITQHRHILHTHACVHVYIRMHTCIHICVYTYMYIYISSIWTRVMDVLLTNGW